MKIRTIRRDKVFIPKFNDNRDLPENEQIKVHIKSFPAVTEIGKYRTFRTDGGDMIEVAYPADAIMLVRHVGKIENVEVESGEPTVFDGQSLAKSENRALRDLVAEIRDYLINDAEELPEGES